MTTPGTQGKSAARIDGENSIFGRREPARRETGHFRRRWEDRGAIPAETLAEKGRPAYTGVGIGESKRKFRLNRKCFLLPDHRDKKEPQREKRL
jgi:hypothetical protein